MKYKIVEDGKYGFLRLDPIPTAEEVEKFYLEEFYSGEYKNLNDSELKVQKEDEEFYNSRWKNMCDNIEKHFGTLEGVSVFDVGFGYGQALSYFQNKKMKVSGIEPSNEGVEHAKALGMNVFQSGIENFSCVEGQKFDVVTIINVLEHLRNPVKTLLNIKEKLLKPNGLLIIDVPNEFNDFQTIANDEYKLNNWWVCPPCHINYFSTSSLSNLLEKVGYKIHYKRGSFPLEMFMLMGDIYVGNSELGKQCHKKRIKFEQLMSKHNKEDKLYKFYEALADLDLGRDAIVYANI